MPLQPTTNFKGSDGIDLGRKLVTNEYLYSVYPQINNPNNSIFQNQIWTIGRDPTLLGINRTSAQFVCTPVTTLHGGGNWKVVYGGFTSYSITRDGSLWGWGRSEYNLLGQSLAANTGASTPVPISFASAAWATTRWKEIATSGTLVGSYIAGFPNWAYGIRDDDTLWTWGGNYFNLNGAGPTNTTVPGGYLTTPQQITGGGTWKTVTATGRGSTAAIKTDGTLWVWGYNYNAQLGINVSGDRTTPVTTFAGGNNWKQVAGGNGNITAFAAIKTDGTLWTWGRGGGSAQGGSGLGNGLNSGDRSTPITTFAGGTNWKSVHMGNNCCAAIKTDGTLWVWGTNGQAQLGTNDATPKCTPVTTFAGGTNWMRCVVIDGGSNGDGTNSGMAAIKTDGTLWVWGRCHRGQLGLNQASGSNSLLLTRSTPVTTFAGGSNWRYLDAIGLGWVALRSF